MELMRAFGFTAKDLQANHAGRLTADQLARLRHASAPAAGQPLVLIVTGSAIMLLSAAVYLGIGTLRSGEPGWHVAGFVGLAAVLDIVFVAVLLAVRRPGGPAPVLSSVRGTADIGGPFASSSAVQGDALQGGPHLQRGPFLLNIGNRQFCLTPPAAAALRPGREYLVYFVEGQGIVSIEAL